METVLQPNQPGVETGRPKLMGIALSVQVEAVVRVLEGQALFISLRLRAVLLQLSDYVVEPLLARLRVVFGGLLN